MSTRSLVLEELERNKGIYISGEQLAEICKVSRNAIWKCVADLRRSGYDIASQNNKGYCLAEKSDIISEEGIELYLPDELRKNIYVFDVLDSTNTEAKRLILNENGAISHGTLIVARSQSGGRGHGGLQFDSPEGGIYISIILEPDKMKDSSCPVTEYIASVVKASLEEAFGIKVSVKKNNAVFQGKKKICGILTEGISDLETGIYSNYIAGIGIRISDIKMPSAEGNEVAIVNRNQLIARLLSDMC